MRWCIPMRIAALLCCLWLAACSRVAPAELAKTESYPLAQEHGGFVTVDALQMFAITMGSGRDVVLIHGDPSSTWSWRKVMAPLSEHFRVHAIDLPGFGFSDKPDVSYDDTFLERCVVGYLDEEGIKSAALVGNSMGGLVASEVAIVHPERVSALVLIDAAGIPSKNGYRPPLIARLARWPVLGPVIREIPFRGTLRDGLRDAVYDPNQITEEEVDAYYLPLRTEGGTNAFLARMSQPEAEDRPARIRTIKAPTLVITGDTDRLVPPQAAHEYHELIAGSELVVFEKTGHLPQEERPERTAAEITRFLQAHP